VEVDSLTPIMELSKVYGLLTVECESDSLTVECKHSEWTITKPSRDRPPIILYFHMGQIYVGVSRGTNIVERGEKDKQYCI
jgi:hypothetical protein